MLYSFQKVYYDIIYQNKTCTKNSLDAAFVPIAIPFDAKHRAQVVLGSLSAPGEGLLVNNWVGSDAEIKGKLSTLIKNITISMKSTRFIFHTSFSANYSLTFTEFGCIPIVTLYHVDGVGHFLSRFVF